MAMDFFASQDQARKKTGRLIILFVLAVFLMIAALHFVTASAIAFAGTKTQAVRGSEGPDLSSAYTDPIIMLTVGGATLLIVLAGSGYKIAQLAGGGHVVAESLGGRRISPDTSDPDERKVLNVVEEMAIASGTSVPPVFLLENEEGINAFAAGYSPDDAVIGVTRGSIALLSRDELQGVIAHEFSHILNGDMRLNIRLMGVLHGILVIGIIGYFLSRVMFFSGAGGRRRSSRDGGGNAALVMFLVALGMMIVGFVGTFFGNLIKAAVSRQREYLADASAVQFTRHPGGIGRALAKIGGYTNRAKIEHPNAPQASHMYFGQAITSGLSSMFATHPPLDDRINRVMPDWDGSFPKVRAPSSHEQESAGTSAREESRGGFRGAPGIFGAGMGAGARAGAGGETGTGNAEAARREALVTGVMGAAVTMSAIDMIGQPSPRHMDYASQLIDSIPESIREAAHESFGSRAVVFALLIDEHDDSCRDRQLDALRKLSEDGVYETTMKLLPDVQALGRETRLPLIDLALPALEALSSSQFKSFSQILRELIKADEKIDLFEGSLQRILRRHLAAHFGQPARRGVRYYGLQRLSEPCERVLSALAHAGTGDAAQAAEAFKAGAAHLEIGELPVHSRDSISLSALDDALDALSLTAPKVKRRVLEACAICVAHDREITPHEAELLRAIADGLGCPIPPLLPGQPLRAASEPPSKPSKPPSAS